MASSLYRLRGSTQYAARSKVGFSCVGKKLNCVRNLNYEVWILTGRGQVGFKCDSTQLQCTHLPVQKYSGSTFGYMPIVSNKFSGTFINLINRSSLLEMKERVTIYKTSKFRTRKCTRILRYSVFHIVLVYEYSCIMNGIRIYQ